jgi:hypothetical protein
LVIDKQFNRRDCYSWLKNNNYPIPGKSACIYCPFHSNVNWLDIKNNHKDDWDECVQFDKDIRHKMRSDKFKAYLHKECVPLDEAELDPHKNQIDMFNNECEGMCGV